MLGPWRLATMWGFLRATLLTKAVTVLMYVIMVASSCTMPVVYTIATVGPINVSGCLCSEGASTGPRDDESLSRQATTPLKPEGSATFGLDSGDSGDDIESDFSCKAHLHSSALQCWALLLPTPKLQHHYLNSPRVRGVCWAGITNKVGMQHLCPAREVAMGYLPLFFPLMLHRGAYLGLQLACWPWLLEQPVPHWAPPWGLPLP